MSVAPIRQLKQYHGGVEISYYDGSTLLGTKKVPIGKDALHPSITMPSKTGKVFVGWATTNSEADWVSALAADEARNLYAIYVSTSANTVASGSIITDDPDSAHPKYVANSKNTTYVTGTLGGKAEDWYSVDTDTKTFTFVLDKKFYATATVKLGQAAWNTASQKFDGSSFSNGTTKTIDSGSHTIWLSSTNSSTGTWSINAGGVTSLSLSNPTAWT